jgi:hypothetical protein
MTSEPEPARPEARRRAVSAARDHARQATLAQVRAAGADIVARPMFADDPSSLIVRDAVPADGMRAIELAARAGARDYIKRARQEGVSWHEIGDILGLEAPEERASTIADAAFNYAAGPATSRCALAYDRSFPWTCPTCRGVVRDAGPCSGPADDEPGHRTDCKRLAADVAAWLAQW